MLSARSVARPEGTSEREKPARKQSARATRASHAPTRLPHSFFSGGCALTPGLNGGAVPGLSGVTLFSVVSMPALCIPVKIDGQRFERLACLCYNTKTFQRGGSNHPLFHAL